MKKFFETAFFLAILTLALIFVYSCKATGKETEGNKNSTDKGEQTTEISDGLPDVNFDGYEFRIFIRDSPGRNKDFVAEAEGGDSLEESVYARNKAVENRFDIKIKFVYDDSAEVGNPAMRAIMADEDAFDLLALHGTSAFSFANEGLVLDWLTEISYVDFSKPWWNDDITNGFAAMGRLYCVTGDISYLSFGSVMCTIFNKRLFADLGIDFPYGAVENSEWTLDKFSQIIKDGKSDLNGDAIMNPSDDRYGLFMTNEFGYPVGVLYAGGDRVISLDSDGVPYLSVYNERTMDIFDKFFDILRSDSACFGKGIVNLPLWSVTEENIFKDGRALFIVPSVDAIVGFRDMDDDIGILPLPKYAVSTPKYYSPLEGGVNIFLVPITALNLDRIGIIVEALAIEGHEKIMPEYYERNLKGKFVRDIESENMLGIIRDGIVYDYGYFNFGLATPFGFSGTDLVMQSAPNFASFYETNEAAVNARIQQLIDNMG